MKQGPTPWGHVSSDPMEDMRAMLKDLDERPKKRPPVIMNIHELAFFIRLSGDRWFTINGQEVRISRDPLATLEKRIRRAFK